jgi:glycosyltransferase involved in cell wall biosynthesis
LLADAEALVNPIRWPEPFGLVMLEAMACGTPVLAFAEGAAPEIVAHGTTGFVCSDEGDMARHLDLVHTIDRQRCRDRVETQFSTATMVKSYLRAYHQVINGFSDRAVHSSR